MEGRDTKQHNFAIVIQIIGVVNQFRYLVRVEMLKHHRPTSHHTLRNMEDLCHIYSWFI